MLNQQDIEGVAESLYRAAGYDPSTPVSPMRLAIALLGGGSVRRFDGRGLRGDAYICKVFGEWRIYLREGLDVLDLRFNLAHELAEWAILQDGLPAGIGDTERAADAIAAAILIPAGPADRLCARAENAWEQIALDFGTTHTCAALRVGEVTNESLALIAPGSIRFRGAERDWPSEEKLRSRRPGPGLRKTRLRDDRRRVVIRATV